MPDATAPKVSWDKLLTITARRGDIAAAAQALGHANNPSAEAMAFRDSLNSVLNSPGQGEVERLRERPDWAPIMLIRSNPAADPEHYSAWPVDSYPSHGEACCYEPSEGVDVLRQALEADGWRLVHTAALPAAVPSEPSALEELAAEYERRAAATGIHPMATNTYLAAASLCREKAAALKGGEGRG